MKIKGLQKTTLIDYPGQVACVIFLFGCNFRCGFCYNPGLIVWEDSPDLGSEEVLEFLRKRKGKLDAVCISGGEPLMTLDFDFVKKIKEMGYKIKIDTNGSFPDRLKKLIDLRLVDYIAMDIKGSKDCYPPLVGRIDIDFEKIEESMRLITEIENYEFRTTIVEGFHGIKEVQEIGRWVGEVCGKKPSRFFLQGFRNPGELLDKDFENYNKTTGELLERLKKVAEDYFEGVEIRI
jgi:pyruvate formate lyase activating enzyme